MSAVQAETLPEYQVKAGFLYNFISFTDWPESTGDVINVCVYGTSPFGVYINQLDGKKAASRELRTHTKKSIPDLENCQVIFVASDVVDETESVIRQINGRPILLVADSKKAYRKGVMINMQNANKRVAFDVNLQSVRQHGLNLKSKLLRLANEVIQ